MNFEDIIARKISYPYLYPFLIKDCHELYKRKLEIQYLDKKEIEHYQIEKLRKLLLHAYQNTRYYKRIFDERNFKPRKLSSISELKKLPVLTKQVIRDNLNDLLADKIENLDKNTSGGSTGTPLIFYADKYFNNHCAANAWVVDGFSGWKPGDRMARLWGYPEGYNQFWTPWVKLRHFSTNVKYYDAFDMSKTNLERYHKDLSSFKPDTVLAYASSIYILARYLKENSIKPFYPRKSIITSAERLYPHMRELIEEVFGKIVFDRYGSREVSGVAMECEKHNGFHLQPDDHCIEIVDFGNSQKEAVNKEGLVLVTVLNNLGMPFVRYQIGDVGVWGHDTCSCGKNTRKLQKIIGRTSDTIILENGRMIHGEYFTHAIYFIEGVEKFKFIQENLNEFQILIVKNEKWKASNLNKIYDELYKVLDKKSVKIKINFVKEILPEKSGKFLFTVSRLKIGNLKK